MLNTIFYAQKMFFKKLTTDTHNNIMNLKIFMLS